MVVSSTDEEGNTTEYTYDEYYRTLTETKDGSTITYTYDSQGNLLSEVSDDEDAENTYYTYDEIGNVLTYGDKEFTWNTGRNLESIVDGDNNYSYTYDENGIRTSKTVNGVTTYYNTKDGVILSQTDGTNTMYFQYDTNGIPLGFIYNGVQYFYLTNQMGDVIAVTDSNGNILAEYAYDAWGALLAIGTTNEDNAEQLAIANANPLRYRGYYYDTETGYYYLQSRYYDASICRFINADIPEIAEMSKNLSIDSNLFAYCNNNPVNQKDPTGKFSFKVYIVAALIASLIGAVTKIISNFRKGYRGWKLLRNVSGAAIGNAINAVLLMRFIRQGNKGLVVAALAASAAQVVVDYIEDIICKERKSWKQLTLSFIYNGVSYYIGNYIGGRAIKVNGGWFQPKYVKSFLTKSYGKRLISQTGFGSAYSYIIDRIITIMKPIKAY